MQETSFPSDAGFVVEWQMSDDRSVVIDLSTAESEMVLPDDPHVRSVSTGR